MTSRDGMVGCVVGRPSFVETDSMLYWLGVYGVVAVVVLAPFALLYALICMVRVRYVIRKKVVASIDPADNGADLSLVAADE